MFGDKIAQSVAEAVKKVLATEKLHPNQQKLDVHEPEKDKLTRKDFEMLRSNKKPKNEAFDPLKHVKNPSPAVKTAAKDVKRGSYADRAALMKAGGVKDDRGPRGVTKEEATTEQTSYNPDGSVSFTGQHSSKDPGFSQSVANFNARKLAATTLRGPNGGQVPPYTSAGDDYKANGEKMDVSSTIKIQKKDLPPGGAVQTRYSEEVEEAVESPFTSYKKPREIESRGGSGIKQGTRYGGGKQKDVPTQDEAPKTKKPKGMMNFKEMFGE